MMDRFIQLHSREEYSNVLPERRIHLRCPADGWTDGLDNWGEQIGGERMKKRQGTKGKTRKGRKGEEGQKQKIEEKEIKDKEKKVRTREEMKGKTWK